MARKRTPQHGGKREGAGRPTMFRSARRVKLSIKVTDLCGDLIARTRDTLKLEHGNAATDAAAVEWLVRKATDTPMDQTKEE